MHGEMAEMKVYDKLHNCSEELYDDEDAKVIMKDEISTRQVLKEGKVQGMLWIRDLGSAMWYVRKMKEIDETQMSCLKLIQICIL